MYRVLMERRVRTLFLTLCSTPGCERGGQQTKSNSSGQGRCGSSTHGFPRHVAVAISDRANAGGTEKGLSDRGRSREG